MRAPVAALLTAAAVAAPLFAAALLSAPAASPLAVEYAGCLTVVLRGSRTTCILPQAGRLTLWAPEPVEIRGDGRLVDLAGSAADGGWRFEVDVPPGARRLAISDRRGRRVLALGLARRLSRGNLEQSALRASLRGHLGGLEPALAQTVEAARLWHRAGRPRDQVTEATFAVDQLIRLRRFTEARQLLDRLDLPAAAPVEATFPVLYYRGYLAQTLGDYRSAGAPLREAVRQAGHVGLVRERIMAEQLLALEAQMLGHWREAAGRFRALDRESQVLEPCELARLLNNQAWSQLLAGEGGEASRGADVWLSQAERIVVAQGCRRPTRLNLLINLALAHLQAGRLDGAAAALRRAAPFAAGGLPVERLWRADLEARLALAQGRPREALALDRQIGDPAEPVFSPDGRWGAAFDRALALAALGRRGEALIALGEVERLLDRQSLLVPMDDGREGFVARHSAATRKTLDLLLEGGRAPEAMAVARRSRSRVLRQLATADLLEHLDPERRAQWERAIAAYQAEREALDREAAGDWRLAADQQSLVRARRARREEEIRALLDRAVTALAGGGTDPPAAFPPPRAGELVLTYHRLPGRESWAGFAALGREVAVHRFTLPLSPMPPPGELAARLLLPFRRQIERCRRLLILAPSDLETVDFHALPYAGLPLFAARPVVYGLDLAPRPRAPVPAGGALVVADPQGDLPEALREGEEARAALAAARPAVPVIFLAGDAAQGVEVARRMARVDLLHYAGHGTYSGRGGWESVLPLAGGSRLTLGDLLALPRVPARVVLSACEGSHPAVPAEGGLNLAEAFVLAGADSVLAATRPVGDRAARAFFARFYREGESAPDLETALQRTQRALVPVDPGGDWRFFRLLVR